MARSTGEAARGNKSAAPAPRERRDIGMIFEELYTRAYVRARRRKMLSAAGVAQCWRSARR